MQSNISGIREGLTVIITASPVKSHPSIRHIKTTIESLKLLKYKESTVFEACPIVLAHDGVKDSSCIESYEKYLSNLQEYITPFSNMQIVACKEHVCLSGSVRNAFNHVNTTHVLIIQHDLPFIKEIDMYSIQKDVTENDWLKHIRFPKTNYPEGWDLHTSWFGLKRGTASATYTQTPCWSDNNHICLTTYYTEFVLEKVPDGTFMECVLHPISQYSNSNIFGTWIYNLDSGPYISHTDGRFSEF